MVTVGLIDAATSSPSQINPAAFLKLGVDRAELAVGENAGPSGEKSREAFGIEYGDESLTLRFDPPSRKNEDSADRDGSAIELGELGGEPVGVTLSLFEAVAVGVHWGRKQKLLAVEDDFVPRLASGASVLRLAAGLGLDGEDSSGRENNVIDVPGFLPGFDDFEIMEDADRVGRETVENQADDLLAQQAQPVIGIRDDPTLGSKSVNRAKDKSQHEGDPNRDLAGK
jgi:hypothetical protein